MADEILYRRKKLPVWAVTRRSYGFVWKHAGLLAVPFLLVLAAQILVSLGLSALRAILAGPWIILPAFGGALLIIAMMMSFSVGLHRTVLLDEVRKGAAFLRWDGNLWTYIKACLTLLLFGIAAALVFGLVLFLIFGSGGLVAAFLQHPLVLVGILLPSFFLGVFVLLKVWLAFPAAALGYRDVFYLSWRLTTGNLLRLLAAFLLVSLPLMLASSLLISLPLALTTARAPFPPPHVDLLVLAAGLVEEIIGAASISLTTVMLSLSFFFLFKVADDAGEFSR